MLSCLTLVIISLTAATILAADQDGHIRPYDKNPRYWQYEGQPVLLLGGSKTDHIFLAEGLQDHLDEIAAVGANCVRNTMSQREGVDLKPHQRLPDGKFDLDQWNSDYCASFPGPDGPINSPWFEECREGIDDFRYLSMLGKLVKRDKSSEALFYLGQLLRPVNLDLSENTP